MLIWVIWDGDVEVCASDAFAAEGGVNVELLMKEFIELKAILKLLESTGGVGGIVGKVGVEGVVIEVDEEFEEAWCVDAFEGFEWENKYVKLFCVSLF